MGVIQSRLQGRRRSEVKRAHRASTEGRGVRRRPSSFARICRWGSKRFSGRGGGDSADGAPRDDVPTIDDPDSHSPTSAAAAAAACEQSSKPTNVSPDDAIVCDPNHLAAPAESAPIVYDAEPSLSAAVVLLAAWKSPRNSLKENRRGSVAKNCNELSQEQGGGARPFDHSEPFMQDDLTQELLMQIIRCFPFPSPKPSPRSSPKLPHKEPHRRGGSLNFRRRHNNEKRGSKEEPPSLKPPRNKVIPPDAVSEKFRDSNSALHQLAQVGRSIAGWALLA